MAKLTVKSIPVVLPPPPPPIKTFILELNEDEAVLIRNFVGALAGGGLYRVASSSIWDAMESEFPRLDLFDGVPRLRG